MCVECNGTAVIHRFAQTIYGATVMETKDEDGHWQEKNVMNRTQIGGMDACPQCAARAEAEYVLHKSVVDGREIV